ncbi:MAG: hypothetical protein ACI32E_01215 [Bacilli bacterium]
MKNKKLLVFRNFIVKILVNFTVIFSMLAAFDIVVSSLLGNKTGNFYMWIMIVLFAIIISVILYFIFKINKISILAQIVITYSVVSIGTYVQGYVVRIFSIHDLKFLLISISISLLGLLILAAILLVKNKNENDRLNKYLENFKERDHR